MLLIPCLKTRMERRVHRVSLRSEFQAAWSARVEGWSASVFSPLVASRSHVRSVIEWGLGAGRKSCCPWCAYMDDIFNKSIWTNSIVINKCNVFHLMKVENLKTVLPEATLKHLLFWWLKLNVQERANYSKCVKQRTCVFQTQWTENVACFERTRQLNK